MDEYPYSDNDFVKYNMSMNTDDTISIIKESPAIPWKYSEDKIVKELLEYIRKTYNQH
jgi:hypothetical protein